MQTNLAITDTRPTAEEIRAEIERDIHRLEAMELRYDALELHAEQTGQRDLAAAAFAINGELERPLEILRAMLAEVTVERCGRECDCDTVEEHDAAIEESRRDFLRNPGPPPAHMSAEGIARARATMVEELARLGAVSK